MMGLMVNLVDLPLFVMLDFGLVQLATSNETEEENKDSFFLELRTSNRSNMNINNIKHLSRGKIDLRHRYTYVPFVFSNQSTPRLHVLEISYLGHFR